MRASFKLPKKDAEILFILKDGPLSASTIFSVIYDEYQVPTRERAYTFYGNLKNHRHFIKETSKGFFVHECSSFIRLARRLKKLFKANYISFAMEGTPERPSSFDFSCFDLGLTKLGAKALRKGVDISNDYKVVTNYYIYERESLNESITHLRQTLYKRGNSNLYRIVSIFDAEDQVSLKLDLKKAIGMARIVSYRACFYLTLRFRHIERVAQISLVLVGYEGAIMESLDKAETNRPSIIICEDLYELEWTRFLFRKNANPEVKAFLTTYDDFLTKGLLGASYYCYPRYRLGMIMGDDLVKLTPSL